MTTSRQKTTSATAGKKLSAEEFLRYSRQIILPELGIEGQRRLRKSRVLIIGLGGLGSPCSLYLAAAGVGTLGLVDPDRVALSNLHRQIAHSTASMGRPKTGSAADALQALNPNVKIETHALRFGVENAVRLIKSYDVVVDASDNFQARYLANDACVLSGKPLVHGSVFRFEGQASVFNAPHGPCYRCLYPQPPPREIVPDCADGGVMGVVPGIIGMLQATETIKLLAGIGNPLIGRLLVFDALKMIFREVAFAKNPACPACGPDRTIRQASDLREIPNLLCRSGTPVEEITPRALQKAMKQKDAPLLLDVREQAEHDYCRIPDSTLIPLGELANGMREMDKNRTVVVYCRSGNRSATAVRQLREAGFTKVRNLAGGILAWADEVDPSIPKY